MEQHSFTRWSLVLAGVMLVGTLFWYLMVGQLFPIIPDDFSYSANILSYDNFFDERKNDFSGEILSKTKYSYQVEKKEGNVLTIRNIFDVQKPSGDPIFKVERLYGIDQRSGKHLQGYGDKNRDGYLFAPKDAGKEFTYWHINYDKPAQMKLVGQEVIEGLRLNRYECNYQADQTQNLSFLPGVPENRGIDLDINLQLWVEPATGFLVKYEDHTTAWYYDIHTKERLHPWNRFHNTFEETSISKQIQVALLARETILWRNRYLPLSNFLIILILIVFSLGYPEKKKEWRPHIAATLIIGMGLSASVLFYLSLKKTNDVRIETFFTRDCESVRSSIQYELERSMNLLTSIKTNYISLGKISREQYRTIAKLSLKNNENIISLGWIPIVPFAKRDSFEIKALHDGLLDFKFTELREGKIIPAERRPEYFPIYFSEPDENGKSILGYDLGSSLSSISALEKAAVTGEINATASISLAGNKKDKVFLILIPVYENELGLRPTRSEHNFLSAAISINALVQGAITNINISNNITFSVIDTEMKNKEVLFSNVQENKTYTLSKKSTLHIANRPWLLEFQSVPIYSSVESFMFTILPPSLVALIALFLGAFIFNILSDNELVKFSHIISADLRSPVGNLRSLLSSYTESENKEDKEKLLAKLTTVINNLTTTLNELKGVWKIQKDVLHEIEVLSFEDIFIRTKESFSGFIMDTNAKVTNDFSKAPLLNYSKAYLESIMLNLFSNAIHYRLPNRAPEIHFETSMQDKEVILTVRDNGQGIDLQKYGAKLFQLNNTFHEQPESRGVGLYITKTQILEMGGTISVESEVGKGSTFIVVFNKEKEKENRFA